MAVTGENKTLAVGLGELRVAQNPATQILAIFGLGSCVGISMYDPALRLGGLAHVVLPQAPPDCTAAAKFADTAVLALLEALLRLGAQRYRLQVKLAGGANILQLGGPARELLQIGDRNLAAVEQALLRERLRPAASEVGGRSGRTMRLFLTDGQVWIRSLGQTEKVI